MCHVSPAAESFQAVTRHVPILHRFLYVVEPFTKSVLLIAYGQCRPESFA